MAIKVIIFDLDGCLVDAKEIHFVALNEAITTVDPNFSITRQEHISLYDGLTTKAKLVLLNNLKGMPVKYNEQIWNLKQELTNKYVEQGISTDVRLQKVLCELKAAGYKLAVASNSINSSVNRMLICAGIHDFFDLCLGNEDTDNPKPHPEIYLRCMASLGVGPFETLIIEDSPHGRLAAKGSGAYVLGVRNSQEVTSERIKDKIIECEQKPVTLTWEEKNLNILIPMAGAGSRFTQAGYTFPKPLIDIKNKPMIERVIESLNIRGHYIFIVQQEHCDKFNLHYLLNLLVPNCSIIPIDGITDGAARTTLKAKELIDNNNPLVICNSDQIIEWNSTDFMYNMSSEHVDGGIVTFSATHPKWSFVKTDKHGWVTEVAEKRPISNQATTGHYYWTHGSDYVKYAEQMITKDIRTNNEFYVCPVFNEAIQDQKKIRTYHIEKMWGVGTPEDLQEYLKYLNFQL